MATYITDNQINDLVIGTLNDLGKLRFNTVAPTLQRYEFFEKIMREEKVTFESGKGIQRNLQINTAGSARNVGLFAEDILKVADQAAQINVPWRHNTTNWSWDTTEIIENAEPAKIFDLVKMRRSGSTIDIADLMEGDFWSKPADSTDQVKPFGVFYWLSYSATSGFNGGNASGFTSGPGGLTSSTGTTTGKWANYTAQYANVTKGDLLSKWRTAYKRTNWKAPVDIPSYRRGVARNFRFYVGETTQTQLELVGESQNENLGRDLGSMDEQMVFRKSPVVWIPKLDPLTTALPVIGINWQWWEICFLRGKFMRETGPRPHPLKHAVYVMYLDTSWQPMCTDRRQQILIAKSDPVSDAAFT